MIAGTLLCESCARLREENTMLVASQAQLREELAASHRQIDSLEARIAALSKNSRNSSRPPSSDIVKPGPSAREKPGRKIGGQPGHPRHERIVFSAEELSVAPFEHYASTCPHCGGQGIPQPGWEPNIIQHVEIREIPLHKEEHRYHACRCAGCQKVYYAQPSAFLQKAGLCGPQLTALIGYMKSALHASYSAIRRFLRDVVGLKFSRGYLVKLIARVSCALQDPYEQLMVALANEPALHVDETGHKENGRRWWTWVFRAELYVLFKIEDTRSSQVLIDVLGDEFNGVLGCDFFSAYRKYMREFDVRVQFCLAHLIREIRYLCGLPEGPGPAYGHKLLEAIREMFAIIARAQDKGLNREAIRGPLEAARERILQVARQEAPAERTGSAGLRAAYNLAARLEKYGASYFEFITTPEIEPTNNPAEQAIRFIVIDRLITQGTRGANGRQFCERIWTVLATCAAQKRDVLAYLTAAVQASFRNEPAPTLMPAGP
jgi:transposase